MRTRIRHSAGLTLLETITVSGLLVSTALVLSLAPVSAVRTSGAVSYQARLHTSIRELQLRATLEQVPCTISIEMNSYTLSCEGGRSTLVHAPPGTGLDRAAPPIDIVFHPRGTITPTTVHFRDERMSCSLTIALRGRMREECV